jgi:hypothetical protein
MEHDGALLVYSLLDVTVVVVVVSCTVRTDGALRATKDSRSIMVRTTRKRHALSDDGHPSDYSRL